IDEALRRVGVSVDDERGCVNIDRGDLVVSFARHFGFICALMCRREPSVLVLFECFAPAKQRGQPPRAQTVPIWEEVEIWNRILTPTNLRRARRTRRSIRSCTTAS